MTDRRDERVPSADACVLRPLLERWAAIQPDKVFVSQPDGEDLTYAALRSLTARTAAGLQALGVRQGDPVIVWMPNSLDCLRVWFAINWLGAIYVPINTAYRGGLLAHVIDNAGAALMVVHADLVSRLEAVDTGAVSTLVVFGGRSQAADLKDATGKPIQILDAAVLDHSQEALAEPPRPIAPWDPQSIVYTSGTTGPSKGVLSSYAHLHAMAGQDGFHMLAHEDRYMCNLPLFHVGGTIPVMGMLARGGSIALVPSFSTDTFWSSIAATQSTVVLLLGVMATFLTKRPPGPDDRAHPLRKVIIVPLSEDAPAFAARFGVDVYTLYNMTEISTPLVSGLNPSQSGACGKPRAGVEVRIVDENDCEVPAGATGELIVRTDAPWAMNSGYHKDPEATARGWRNGWFHTGDAFRTDADGMFFFVDRMKDAIRRRGENISSFEVEAEVAAHPLVREVAVVPIPSALSEDDVMCVIAPVGDARIDPVELIDFLRPRLPHFMLPRYVRIVDALPKTPTQKIQKHTLRSEGVVPGTWDREEAGVPVRRERF